MSDYIYYNGELYHCDSELYHYGVKGMKWGVRRYEKLANKYRKKMFAASKRGNNAKSFKYSKKLDKVLRKSGAYDKPPKLTDFSKRLEAAEQRNKPSKYVNSKTPYYQMSEKQRKEVDNYYKGKMSIFKQKARSAKTESDKEDRMADYYVVEEEYTHIRERDW